VPGKPAHKARTASRMRTISSLPDRLVSSLRFSIDTGGTLLLKARS